MDPVSQAALGAAWAEPTAPRQRVVTAASIGAIAGMAPDLDVLIRSAEDPLLALELHRHFTHSLSFIPLGALVCAALLYPLFKANQSFASCYLFSLLGYASHGLLDACTSYGTLLLWPFSDTRVAWDIVSVVDPLFTVPLIVCVVLAAWRRRPRLALVGLAWCVLYLGLGATQNLRATGAARELAASRGHSVDRIEVKPSFANILVWRSMYEHSGTYFIDAVRVGWRSRAFPGEALDKLEAQQNFPWLDRQSQQYRDLERFQWFAGGWLAVDPDNPRRVLDIRYALVPNSRAAFWGLELDSSAGPEAHAGYVTMRRRSTAEGVSLLRMVFGMGIDT